MRHHTAAQNDAGLWKYVGDGSCLSHAGHATETEARECQAAYLRGRVGLDLTTSNWSGCQVCDAPTKKGAQIHVYMGDFVKLCDEHLTYEIAYEQMRLNEPAGDRWVS